MPSFKPTDLWNAEPHTLAKIEIVRRYLFLWFRILGTSSSRLVYIDGFSGPGRYLNSDQSSPTAALTSAKAAFDELVLFRHPRMEWFFYFIEKEPEFAASLQSVISETTWPAEFNWNVKTGSFEQELNGVLTRIRKLPGGMPPTFAFIDPFGATGVSFSHVAEILKQSSCEVLINLASHGIGRLFAAQSIERNKDHLDAIFGGNMWRETLDPRAPMLTLCAQILALYKERLRSLRNVDYAFSFAMKSSQAILNYHLVFASQRAIGLRKMKDAMKAVDRSGSYSFSDDAVGQKRLWDFNDSEEPAGRMLRTLGSSWRPWKHFDDFALNESPFSDPKPMLRHLKSLGKVEVQWIGEPSKTGFPEERIKAIKLNP
ncbi:MAG: three-Cys-motif partner protein TcmP [Pyrinomonadaceae bacterium]